MNKLDKYIYIKALEKALSTDSIYAARLICFINVDNMTPGERAFCNKIAYDDSEGTVVDKIKMKIIDLDSKISELRSKVRSKA